MAQSYLEVAKLQLKSKAGTETVKSQKEAEQPETKPEPTFFAGGRYKVIKFLGEGGRKKVYLAHDETPDRDVSFALIKTEGLDEDARKRITREAQIMGP